MYVSSLAQSLFLVLAALIVYASSNASANSEIRPMVQWSVTENPTIAKISRVSNLVVYMNQGMGTRDASVTLREIGTGEIRCRWDSQGAPGFQMFSPDGTKLLSNISTTRSRSSFGRMFNFGASGQYVPYIFDTATCAPIRSLVLDKRNYSGWRFSDDGLYLIGVRWKRRYSSNDALFRFRLDGAALVTQYQTYPPQVDVYYPIHQNDTFLVVRNARNLEEHWKLVSHYTISKNSDLKPKARWWRREVREENALVETKQGPSYYRKGFVMAQDRSRFALHQPYAHYFGEPTDVYAVIYDAISLEETHRWLFYKSRERREMHTAISFFPQNSDLVLSLTQMGTVMVHRLLPKQVKALLQFDTSIEGGFVDFSHDGSLFVVSGQVSGQTDGRRILIYKTENLGIDI